MLINKSYYKYFDARGALLTLLTRHMRFSSPKYFNDPYDFNFFHQPPFSAGEMRRLLALTFVESIKNGKVPHQIEKMTIERGMRPIDLEKFTHTDEELLYMFMGEGTDLPEIHRKHQQAKIVETNQFLAQLGEDHFVYCLTTNPTSNHMWERYANNHSGVVLQFDCCPEVDNVFLAAKKVKYSESPPTYGTKEEWLSFLREGTPIDHKKIYEDRTLTKGLGWEIENEWRIILPSTEDKGKDYHYVGFRPEDLGGIFLGHQLTGIERDLILRVRSILYPNVSVYQSELFDNMVIFKRIN